MSGIIYEASFSRTPIVKYEDGMIKNIYDRLIGQYDTTGNYKSVYCGAYKISNNIIGHTQYTNGYLSDNSSIFIYAKGSSIYNSSGGLLAHFDGDVGGALAAYIVYHYNKVQHTSVNSTVTTPSSSTNVSSTSSSYTPTSSSDGSGCLYILLGLLALPLVAWLGWNLNVAFWTNMLSKTFESGNWFGLIFFYGVTIFCTIFASIGVYQGTRNRNVIKVFTETFSSIYNILSLGMVVGGIALLIEVIVTKASFWNLILAIFGLPLMYSIIGFFPAVIASILTAILVLFKGKD